jgi:NADPH-dependent 2,4-dienoyl-CoA reductase/sulfur reductase-like enzyme
VATSPFEHVLIGGGIAAGHALDTLIKEGIPGRSLALVCAEPELPYHRPPLSKGYLLGSEPRDSIFLKPEGFYEEQGITVLRSTKATAVDPKGHVVTLDHGQRLQYGKLLIATGCTPRTLSVPGSDLPGIFTLRTLEDSEKIRDAATRAKRAVVVGGGFIGMELASAFSQKGLLTTILHRGNAVFDKLGSPEISRFFGDYYTARGVEIRFEDEAVGFRGSGTVSAVLTKKGETLLADLVAVGIGVVPDVSFLEGSGIVVENGITVNEYMETSVPDAYAAGDVALFFDPLYQKHRRIEHWDTAIQQGKVAGKNMAGTREPYGVVSFFFSDIFDLSFDYFGDAEGTDRMIQRGTFADKAVSIFSVQQNVVRAAFTMGRPKERMKTIRLIKEQTPISDLAALGDLGTPLP